MRSFRCHRCGTEEQVETRTGPLPSTCSTSDPEGAARRAAPKGESAYARRGRELEAARAELARMRAVADFDRAADQASRALPAGRRGVGVALRQLAAAEGPAATQDALLQIAGACRSWARTLGADIDINHEQDDQEAAA